MARLEPEQDQLLVMIVELVRSVPRDQRHSFLLLEMQQGDWLLMPGATARPRVLASDVRILERAGILQRAPGASQNSTPYDVTPEGFEYYDRLKREAGGPTEAIEEAVTRYLDAPDFASRHPGSYAKWQQAAEELWSTDSETGLTSVGHHVREAMQLLATEAVEKYNATGAPPEPEKTINRVQAVVDVAAARPGLGDAEKAFLNALVTYWRAVNGLAQRQEHGGSKDVSLVWEDARRLVFQTAFVMFELDRAFTRAFGT